MLNLEIVSHQTIVFILNKSFLLMICFLAEQEVQFSYSVAFKVSLRNVTMFRPRVWNAHEKNTTLKFPSLVPVKK